MPPYTYQEMVKECGAGDDDEKIKHKAVIARGGCCLKCSHKKSIVPVIPKIRPHKLTPANVSVTVVCEIDRTRRRPFAGAATDDCPTKQHYLKKLGQQNST